MPDGLRVSVPEEALPSADGWSLSKLWLTKVLISQAPFDHGGFYGNISQTRKQHKTPTKQLPGPPNYNAIDPDCHRTRTLASHGHSLHGMVPSSGCHTCNRETHLLRLESCLGTEGA